MANVYVNYEEGVKALEPKGITSIAAGESAYIKFNGFIGGIQVHIVTSASFQGFVTLYPDSDVLDDTAEYNELSLSTVSSDVDYFLEPGVNAVMVSNEVGSASAIEVTWSIIK